MNHYETLQVSETASEEVIKGAYRYLAQRWHPDKNPDSKEHAEAQTRKINIAYSILSDKHARAEYDNELQRTRMKKESHTNPNERSSQTQTENKSSLKKDGETLTQDTTYTATNSISDLAFGFLFVGFIFNFIAFIAANTLLNKGSVNTIYSTWWVTYSLFSIFGAFVWAKIRGKLESNAMSWILAIGLVGLIVRFANQLFQ